ncbi:MAG TPA: Hsp20/alpha crystallin family protein [Thermoanaerobaculia bacterium]|nr:Hsp20/alpha crystallin family protein [Thermoanaerobaculia bacterium]
MGSRYPSLFLVSRFQSELDRLFQEALQLGESSVPFGEWHPWIDIVETPAAVLILAELPGLAAADLKIEIRGTRILLSGTKSTPLPGAQRVKFHCMERGHGRFSREIHLFSPVNTHQGTARLANGLLTIEFPKIQDKRQEARLLHIEEVEGRPEESVDE